MKSDKENKCIEKCIQVQSQKQELYSEKEQAFGLLGCFILFIICTIAFINSMSEPTNYGIWFYLNMWYNE